MSYVVPTILNSSENSTVPVAEHERVMFGME